MDKYGLIGYPLGHSFSKHYFAEKFAREGLNAVYENYAIEDAGSLLEIVRTVPELRGLNCTIPHKQAIVPLMDELSDEAREIGAVNVIRIRRQQNGNVRLKGFNSDYIGFAESIKPLLSQNHHNALVLGTGGASKAICYALTRLGLQWTLVSRNRREGILSYDDLTPKIIQQHQIIVNCTPMGMFPHIGIAPPLPYEVLTPQHLLYDLIYNPEETLFLRMGAQHGAIIKNGWDMLRLQAEASWSIWHENL